MNSRERTPKMQLNASFSCKTSVLSAVSNMQEGNVQIMARKFVKKKNHFPFVIKPQSSVQREKKND